MPNTSQSSIKALQGSVTSDPNQAPNTTPAEATYLFSTRIASYLSHPDQSIPHVSTNDQHAAGQDTVFAAVSKMSNKLHDFDATYHHNNGGNGGSS